MFTDVQELAGMGGLNSYASGDSLWLVAAQAGIVDVDRWVVAAVLWQAVDAVEQVGERAGVIESRCKRQIAAGMAEGGQLAAINAELAEPGTGKTKVVAFEQRAENISAEGSDCLQTEDFHDGASGTAVANKRIFFATKATSLWEELCREAFKLVTTSVISNQNKLGGDPSSSAALRSSSCKRQPAMSVDIAKGRCVVPEDTEHTQRRYEETASASNSFDHALMQTLHQASRGASKAVQCADARWAGDASAAVTPAVALAGGGVGPLMCVEEALLTMYVVAGFTTGSNLEVADIVEAVKVRRERTSAERTTRLCSHGTVSSVRWKNRCRRENPRELEDLASCNPFSRYSNVVKVRGESLKEKRQSEVEAASVGTEANLVGVPPELQELFRTAARADTARRKQQQVVRVLVPSLLIFC